MTACGDASVWWAFLVDTTKAPARFLQDEF